MVRENKHIRNNDILVSTRRPHDCLCNILACQWCDTLVHRVRLLLVSTEPHDRELRLDLPGVDLDDPDPRRDQLLPHRVRKAAHGGLGCAVDAAALVRFATSNGSDVDDVASAALALLLHHAQHGLRHVDQTEDVGVELHRNVSLLDITGLVHALDQPGIVDQNIDVLEFLWQVGNEVLNFFRLANVKLHR